MKPILNEYNIETSKHTNYFQITFNDLKNTWKDIKKLIPLKRTLNAVPSAVIENDIILTKREEIANVFSKYFVTVSVYSQIFEKKISFLI